MGREMENPGDEQMLPVLQPEDIETSQLTVEILPPLSSNVWDVSNNILYNTVLGQEEKKTLPLLGTEPRPLVLLSNQANHKAIRAL